MTDNLSGDSLGIIFLARAIRFAKRNFINRRAIEVGNFAGLYNKLNSNTLEIATPDEVSWPSDMKDYAWNPDSLNSIASRSRHE